MPIVLASQSAIRAAVLKGAGLEFTTVSPGVDEDVVKHGLLARGASPKEVAHVLAEEKAKAGSLKADGLVIGADQTLDLDGRLYDKARSLDEARAVVAAWRQDYNQHRPHSALGYQSPAEFAAVWRARHAGHARQQAKV